jgi:hypothetical protein
MADFATKSEVLTMAFQRTMPESRIEDGLINAVQVKHLMPILGEDFYDDVVANPINYTTLLTYLKPIVAQFVKYYILPQVYLEISNSGVNQVPGNNRTPASMDGLGIVQQNALDHAELLVKALVKYLDDNSATFTLYYPSVNPAVRYEIAGGIIFKNDIEDDDFYSKNND